MTNITTNEFYTQLKQCSPELQEHIIQLKTDSDRLQQLHENIEQLKIMPNISHAIMVYMTTDTVHESFNCSNLGRSLPEFYYELISVLEYGDQRFGE